MLSPNHGEVEACLLLVFFDFEVGLVHLPP
jgi:hypothetical protein